MSPVWEYDNKRDCPVFVTEMSPVWEYDNKRDCPEFVTEMSPVWEYDNKRDCPVFVTEMSPVWEYDNKRIVLCLLQRCLLYENMIIRGLSCVCYRDVSCMRIW